MHEGGDISIDRELTTVAAIDPCRPVISEAEFINGAATLSKR